MHDRVRAVLGDRLVGLYLHGSLALGDFSGTRSDVDGVAVTSGPLSDKDEQTLATKLSSTALPCPATGLELHVVERDALTLAPAPRFELHLATSAARDRVVDGRGHAGDPDLLMHFAVLHDRGVALSGPPPDQLFPRPPREALLAAFVSELRWAADHASPSYQVLNACRAWRFAEENVLCSKTEGADWARRHVEDAAAIDAALRHRRGAAEQPSAPAAAAVLRRVLAHLEGLSLPP